MPLAQNNVEFGWPGVLRGASVLFFAYVGFEMVSTSAAETLDPNRNLPIGVSHAGDESGSARTPR